MKRNNNLLILITLLTACKKPYYPAAIAAPGSYLVVEGVINSGPDSTIIKLSRTVNLSSAVTINPEPGAVVTVESDQNNSYPLAETTTGYYTAPGLNLNTAGQYRLRIKTADNQQYLSDFVAVKVTPPIDSVGFNIISGGLQIYLNTHDPNNNTHYYRWDYSETWQFHAQYYSQYVSNGKAIVFRQEQIYNCFGNDFSSSIILGSSAKLQQDMIYQNPLTLIPPTSEKIETKYSILVRQYALTGDAYNFWVNLKKNTEQLGSIFDAQPSNISGNIHSINNPSEPVIGYISACTVQSKRIFISNAQLPQSWLPAYPYTCAQDSNYYVYPPNPKINQVKENLIPLPNSNVPTSAFYLHGAITPSGYLASDVQCVDCTIRGTTTTPAFWK